MKALRASRSRFISGLVVGGCLALAAVQPLAAHAAPGHTPYITVNDGDWGPINPHVRVQGINFVVNDPVLIEAVTLNGAVVAREHTVARGVTSARRLSMGAFAAELTVSATYRGQTLRFVAIDAAKVLRSNIITLRLPRTPIPTCKPYTCL